MGSNKFFVAGVKFYEFLKLAVTPKVYKSNESKEYVSFILKAIERGQTVLDIGSHKRDYFFTLLKIAKSPGKVVAFDSQSGICNYLLKMKHLLKLKNVTIEHLAIAETTGKLWTTNTSYKSTSAYVAPVIDFKERINLEANESITIDTIDNYCTTHRIVPGLLKFKLERNGLNILLGATEVLKKYKPQVLIETAESHVSQETLLKTFKFLSDLKYSGYFILDTMKIPLASFDFNIYQNEVLGFYCNSFLFE